MSGLRYYRQDRHEIAAFSQRVTTLGCEKRRSERLCVSEATSNKALIMKTELDEQLVAKHPKIFRDRYKPMHETAMCWGFECGDGWYNIIDQACDLIDSHYKYMRDSRARALRWNRALARAKKGDTSGLVHDLAKWATDRPDRHTEEIVQKAIAEAEKKANEFIAGEREYLPSEVEEIPPEVVAAQVKEKFGTLRFYYHGGDDFVSGVAQMAEAMSAVTCEECGAPGKLRAKGWWRTLCDDHAALQGT